MTFTSAPVLGIVGGAGGGGGVGIASLTVTDGPHTISAVSVLDVVGAAVSAGPTGTAVVTVATQTGGTISGGIQQNQTGQFYVSSGAQVNRINDRLLVGAAATAQDGNSGAIGKSWLAAVAGGVDLYMDTLSVMEVLTIPGASQALSAGARTSDVASGQTGAFGITTVGYNNATGGSQSVWGLYSSAVRATSPGVYTAGIESDVTTLLPYVASSAYNTVPSGVTTAYTAAAGGETALAASGLAVNPTSAAFTVFPAGTGSNQANSIAGTGAVFGKGIVIQSNAIVGTDGSSGTFGVAMEMAKGHAIVWANNTGATAIGGMIRSDNVAGQSPSQSRLIFGPDSLQIKGVNADLVTENLLAEFLAIPRLGVGVVVNNPVFYPSASGDSVGVGVEGSDTNIDLQLIPKGTGVLWLGAGAISASVAANFTATNILKIKDGAGTVYFLPCRTSTW